MFISKAPKLIPPVELFFPEASDILYIQYELRHEFSNNVHGILTSVDSDEPVRVDSDEPVQPPFKLRNSK